MKLRNFGILFAALMIIAAPAWALDLHQARASGLVGETPYGYVEALKETAEVQTLVTDVNTRRQQEYVRISKENNQTIDVVAKLAAKQIISGLEPGTYYQTKDGDWIVSD